LVVKNSVAVLVRAMEQAVRDGIIDRNSARVTGWQREFQRAEDDLDDPRSLAIDAAGVALSAHLSAWRSPGGPGSRRYRAGLIDDGAYGTAADLGGCLCQRPVVLVGTAGFEPTTP
jgi:hypothetical protein